MSAAPVVNPFSAPKPAAPTPAVVEVSIRFSGLSFLLFHIPASLFDWKCTIRPCWFFLNVVHLLTLPFYLCACKQPVAESQLAPIEEDYVEEGELDEADMTAEEGQEDMEGGWDESNADSGDFEEGEI